MQKNLVSSIHIIGTGIKTLSHITKEVEAIVRSVDKVFFLVNNPISVEWVEANSKNNENLDYLYNSNDESRIVTYNNITNHIVSQAAEFKNICYLVDGHPNICVRSTQDIAEKAKLKNIKCYIYPAISAMDCVFSDFSIDPLRRGVQIYEGTNFLKNKKIVDPSSYLILFQVGFLGVEGHLCDIGDNSRKLIELQKYLKKSISASAKLYLYEAAMFPHQKAQIKEININDLPNQDMTPLTTLVIMPE